MHKQDIYLSKSSIDFEDRMNPVRLKHEAGREFIEFTAGNHWTEEMYDRTQALASVFFRVASKRRAYSLNPYNILDLLGDMGGLLDIVMAFGMLLTVSEV